jgi:hypothetical protein
VSVQSHAVIRASGKTYSRMKEDIGVKPEIVARIARGERDIRAATFAKLCTALMLELQPKENRL